MAATAGGTARDPGGDWPASTTEAIERTVERVRSKTTEPLERLARVVVYGLLAAVLGTAAVVLLAVMAVRALDIVLPDDVWLAHLVVGGIFCVAGLFLWGKRHAKTAKV